MAPKNINRPPQNAALSNSDMRAALVKLDKRINELTNLDFSAIIEREDTIGTAVKNKINNTLQEIFGYDSIEYRQYSIHSLDTLPYRIGHRFSIDQIQEGFKKGAKEAIVKLNTLKEIFQERLDDSEIKTESVSQQDERVPGRKVFVVHGHDDHLKEKVARFLSTLKLDPIILHEQVNEGRTIVEKFEKYSDVDFAVVLFTPDDMAYSARSLPESARPRARQNVVLELGFFMGQLGRKKVAALYVGEVELPSDYSGVLYIAADASGAWKYSLAREIRQSGINIDMNLI